MKKYKVAVIAVGFVGVQHIEAIRRVPNNEVVAVVGSNMEGLKEKAKRLGVLKVYTDYKLMIDEVKPDVIHNCTPNYLHFEINKYAMERGINVFCEKPLAITVQEGEELVRLAKEKNVACGVNFNYRSNAIIQEIKERVSNGSVGRIFHVTGQYKQDWLMLDTDYNWRLDEEKGGVSRTIADIGSHWFDTVQVALGKKIVSVRAELITVHPFRKKMVNAVETFASATDGEFLLVPINSEDCAFVQVRFEDGTFGTVNLSQVSGGCLNDFRLEIAGEKCSLEWRQENPDYLMVGTREFGTQIVRASPNTLTGEAVRFATLPAGHPVAWTDALTNGIREYYKSIDEGTYSQNTMTYSTFSDGVQIMKLVEACLRSAKSGDWVLVQ